MQIRRAVRLTVALAALTLLASACATTDEGGGGGGGGGGAKKIALLLPETKTTRYEAQDRPLFVAKMKALCGDCEIIYSNADQKADLQQNQADAALTNGAKVMVLDPVDSASAASIVTKAKSQNVPVISYDRLILNADVDYYISFDNEKVGQLQGQALVDKLKEDGKSGSIVMINGAPTDNNAKLFKKGAHSVIDSSGLKVGKEYDTPDWSPDKAQNEMEQAITALGKNGFVGVYAANDGTGGGAIAAMKGQGIDPASRPTTGQDAELAAIQRILIGDQYMTVYKAIKPEAEQAAELAVNLVNGNRAAADALATAKVNNGQKDVASVLLTPVALTSSLPWKDRDSSTGFLRPVGSRFTAVPNCARRLPALPPHVLRRLLLVVRCRAWLSPDSRSLLSGPDSPAAPHSSADESGGFLRRCLVTKDNIKDTIVADNFLPTDQICSGPAASACTAAGIS